MYKFISGLIVGVLLFGLFVRLSWGQGATASTEDHEIRQGDTVSMNISADKPSNVDGSLFVSAAPEGSTDAQMFWNCPVSKGSTSCEAHTSVPFGAIVGKWAIVKIAFQATAGSKEKELMKHGEASFQIVARNDVVFPESATISGIK
jgi:hypothetical protein